MKCGCLSTCSSKGRGRLGLLVRIAMEEDITWNNYRKFQVDSRVVGAAGAEH